MHPTKMWHYSLFSSTFPWVSTYTVCIKEKPKTINWLETVSDTNNNKKITTLKVVNSMSHYLNIHIQYKKLNTSSVLTCENGPVKVQTWNLWKFGNRHSFNVYFTLTKSPDITIRTKVKETIKNFLNLESSFKIIC